jgi:hypothetical protein
MKYTDAVAFVRDLVETLWNEGNPLSKAAFFSSIRQKYMNTGHDFATGVLKSRNYPNSLHKFAERTLKAINFTCRKSSISPKVPEDWREIAIAGAERVRARFLEEEVDVILAADETFLKFHQRDDSLLVPSRVPLCLKKVSV